MVRGRLRFNQKIDPYHFLRRSLSPIQRSDDQKCGFFASLASCQLLAGSFMKKERHDSRFFSLPSKLLICIGGMAGRGPVSCRFFLIAAIVHGREPGLRPKKGHKRQSVYLILPTLP
jgi:hypothetical protein